MDFKKRIIEELELSEIQAETLLKDYVITCEKLAKEYYKEQLNLCAVISCFSLKKCLEYEVHSSWLAPLISFSFGQKLAGTFFANKVRRKYKRYKSSLEYKQKILNSL